MNSMDLSNSKFDEPGGVVKSTSACMQARDPKSTTLVNCFPYAEIMEGQEQEEGEQASEQFQLIRSLRDRYGVEPAQGMQLEELARCQFFQKKFANMAKLLAMELYDSDSHW